VAGAAAFARPLVQRMLGRLVAIVVRPEHVQPLKPHKLGPAA